LIKALHSKNFEVTSNLLIGAIARTIFDSNLNDPTALIYMYTIYDADLDYLLVKGNVG
jgi:hypothetical protein